MRKIRKSIAGMDPASIEHFGKQLDVEKKIDSIDRKWQAPELNEKLEQGDVRTVLDWERDYLYRRELRLGLLER